MQNLYASLDTHTKQPDTGNEHGQEHNKDGNQHGKEHTTDSKKEMNPLKPLQALIVDDERLARRELRRLLEEEFSDRVCVVGEASTKNDAIAFIEHPPENTHPEIVFLDVNMPHGSGFDVLEALEQSVEHEPARPTWKLSIVFVTAYDEYAVRAFEVNALDYLLKPPDPERLAKTIERLWRTHRLATTTHIEHEHDSRYSQSTTNVVLRKSNSVLTQEESVGTGSGYGAYNSADGSTYEQIQPLSTTDYLFLVFGKQRRFVPVSELVCITTNDNYTELWVRDESSAALQGGMPSIAVGTSGTSTIHGIKRTLMLRTMNEWEQCLPVQLFQRIHRSTLVNLSWFDHTKPTDLTSSGGQIFLHGIDEPFAVSRRYAAKLKERLLGLPTTNE